MSTKMGIWRWALASAAILLAVGTASARVVDPTGISTNDPTAIVIWPGLKVDPNTCQGGFCSLTNTACALPEDCAPACEAGACTLLPEGAGPIACTTEADCPGAGRDTVVQLTNTSEFLTKVHCFYTNTNGHCSNNDEIICTEANFRSVCPSGGLCEPGWQETDFSLTLTKRQPISWSVDNGLQNLPLATQPGQAGQRNEGNIPPVLETPFTGELFCVQVTADTEVPSDRNDLKGEASIVTTVFDQIDARKYNAIGIKAIEGRQDGSPTILNVGGPDAEYGAFDETEDPPRFIGCPNILTLNHFFDGANVISHEGAVEGRVRSDLTLVPCARDYLAQIPEQAVVQFLVFNEFEQRFSTSTSVRCYKETRLSDIDTRPGPEGDSFSIFSVGVQGTLTGMSRLRSVQGPNVDNYDARTVLALLTENWASGTCESPEPGTGGAAGMNGRVQTLCAVDADCEEGDICVNGGSAAVVKTTGANVQSQGSRFQGDRIIIIP
jgi:hypothetical protein